LNERILRMGNLRERRQRRLLKKQAASDKPSLEYKKEAGRFKDISELHDANPSPAVAKLLAKKESPHPYYQMFKEIIGACPEHEEHVLRLVDEVLSRFDEMDEISRWGRKLTKKEALSSLHSQLFHIVKDKEKGQTLPKLRAKIAYRMHIHTSRWKEKVGRRVKCMNHYRTEWEDVMESRSETNTWSTFDVEVSRPLPRSVFLISAAMALLMAASPVYNHWGEDYLKREWWPTAERFEEPQARVFRGFRKGCKYPQVIEESKTVLKEKVDSDIPRLVLPEIAEKELDGLRCAEFYYRALDGNLETFGYNVWRAVEGKDTDISGPLPYKYRF